MSEKAEHVENDYATAKQTNRNSYRTPSFDHPTPSQQLKATISFRALVESDGIPLKQSGSSWKCRCPFHPDRTPSFSIYQEDDRAKCYGCNWYGDIFKYVMDRTGCNFGTAFHHLKDNPTLLGTRTLKSASKALQSKEEDYQFTEKELKEIERSTSRIIKEDWLCEKIAACRNWKPETIRSLALSHHLGWGGDALNFIYKTGIKVRQWPGKNPYWWAGEGYLWRFEQLAGATKVFLTEGEPDAITLLDSGVELEPHVAVVAAPSASTFGHSWAKMFKDKDVTICYDADEAGRKGAASVSALLIPVAKTVSDFNPEEVA